jgi:hypothetical protein
MVYTGFTISVFITTKFVSSNPFHDEMYSIQHYVSKLSVTCDRSVVSLGTLVYSTKKKWPPQYIWNIVESGIKHHNPNLTLPCQKKSAFLDTLLSLLHNITLSSTICHCTLISYLRSYYTIFCYVSDYLPPFIFVSNCITVKLV